MVKNREKMLTAALLLSFAMGTTIPAYALIGPGEGMGSQGGMAQSQTDQNPWSGYRNADGSAFSYLERGISISKFQNQKGAIDWSKVKRDGIDFAIVRIAYGLTEDPYFDQNVSGAQNAGLKAGAYLCATAKNLDETIAEANLAVSKIRKYRLGYPVAYDMEVNGMLSEGATPEQLTEMANKFCEIVAAAGYTPVVYANTNWLKNHLRVSNIPYDIWFAAYPEDKVYRPVSGTNTTIWQTGDNGVVKGIVGNVTTEFSNKAYGGGNPERKYAASSVSGNSGVIYGGGLSFSDAGPAAARKSGWDQEKDGSWFYYEDGARAKGWKQIKDLWYYFRDDGSMVNGWVEVNGSWYYMDVDNGYMKTGWRLINDLWYYMDENGVMLSNTTRSINGIEYSFNETGACTNP